MAVTILLAAKGSSQLAAHFSASRLQGLLQKARDILEEYEKYSKLASRCNSVLRLIEQSYDRRGSAMETTCVEGIHENTYVQDETTREQQSQPYSDSMDMVLGYTFDWNNWPVFFAELDGENSPIEGWELPT